jgi:hypothetical protein
MSNTGSDRPRVASSGEAGLREHLPLFSELALLFGAAVVFGAQTEHITPFTGTWKLNVAKSRFHPGPAFQSFTLTFTSDGTRKLDLIRGDGQPFKASLPWSDGKEVVPVTQGMANTKVVSQIRGNTVDDTWKQNGKVIEKVHGVVSPDRRTLRITVEGPDGQGGTFHNRLTFEKQQRQIPVRHSN